MLIKVLLTYLHVGVKTGIFRYITLVDYCLPFLYVQIKQRKIEDYLTHRTGRALTPPQNSINKTDACKRLSYEICLSLTRKPRPAIAPAKPTERQEIQNE